MSTRGAGDTLIIRIYSTYACALVATAHLPTLPPVMIGGEVVKMQLLFARVCV